MAPSQGDNRKLDAYMEELRKPLPARCSRCHRRSAPRILGTAPIGWTKITSRQGQGFVYLCDRCRP